MFHIFFNITSVSIFDNKKFLNSLLLIFSLFKNSEVYSFRFIVYFSNLGIDVLIILSLSKKTFILQIFLIKS